MKSSPPSTNCFSNEDQHNNMCQTTNLFVSEIIDRNDHGCAILSDLSPKGCFPQLETQPMENERDISLCHHQDRCHFSLSASMGSNSSSSNNLSITALTDQSEEVSQSNAHKRKRQNSIDSTTGDMQEDIAAFETFATDFLTKLLNPQEKKKKKTKRICHRPSCITTTYSVVYKQ